MSRSSLRGSLLEENVLPQVDVLDILAKFGVMDPAPSRAVGNARSQIRPFASSSEILTEPNEQAPKARWLRSIKLNSQLNKP
jgi:hypothetical protein